MDKIEKLKAELNTLIDSATVRKNVLREEGREDESLFEKIKINVYDIYSKMINVSKVKGDFEKTFESFLNKIPENWYSSLEKSRANGDFEQEQKELIKLEAKVEIETVYNRVFGG